MLKLITGLLVLAALTGCQSFDLEQIGVDDQDNAALCIRASVDPAWSESRLEYSRVELPRGYTVTPEQLADLVTACRLP
jgi:hypothetical protein